MRRARVVLVGNKPKSDIIDLVAQHKRLDDANTKPIVRASRMTKFEIDDNKEIRLVQPDPTGIMLLIPG